MRGVYFDATSFPLKHRIAIIAVVGSFLSLLAVVLFKVDTVVVLGAILALGGVITLVVWPNLATLCFLFAIYSNGAVVACQAHGINTSVVAVLWALLCIPFALYIFARKQPIHIDYPFLWMLVYTGCLLFSFFASRDKDEAIKWIATYLLEGVVLYFLVLNVVRHYDVLKKAIGTILVVGVLLGSMTLYQDVFGKYETQFGGLAQRELRFEKDDGSSDNGSGELIRQREQVRRVQRADGPFGDPNYYAQIMIVLVPLGLVFTINEIRRKRKFVAAVGLLIIMSGLLLTYSRGAFVTLCFLIMTAVVMRVIRIRFVLVAIGAILMVVLIVSPGYFGRVSTIGGVEGLFNGEDKGQTDSVILSRLTEMTAALNVYLDHPLVGVGPGQYKLYSVDYMEDVRLSLKQHDEMRAAHSLYLQLAAETGTLGLVVFMFIPILMLSTLWNERNRWIGIRRDLAYLQTAFFMSILGFLGTGVFLTYAYHRYFWVIMALAGATVRISRLEFAKFQMHEANGSNSEKKRVHECDGYIESQKP